jgi:hypothetical protein
MCTQDRVRSLQLLADPETIAAIERRAMAQDPITQALTLKLLNKVRKLPRRVLTDSEAA